MHAPIGNYGFIRRAGAWASGPGPLGHGAARSGATKVDFKRDGSDVEDTVTAAPTASARRRTGWDGRGIQK